MIEYVLANGWQATIREFNNPNSPFSGKDVLTFAFDQNRARLANPCVPGITSMNRLQDHDAYAEYMGPSLTANAG